VYQIASAATTKLAVAAPRGPNLSAAQIQDVVSRAEREDLRAKDVEEGSAASRLGEGAERVTVATHPLAIGERPRGAVDELGTDQADGDERLHHPQGCGRRLTGAQAQRDVVREDRGGRRAEDPERAAPQRGVGDGEAVEDPARRAEREREHDRGRGNDVERAADECADPWHTSRRPEAEDHRGSDERRDRGGPEGVRGVAGEQKEGRGEGRGAKPEAQCGAFSIENEDRLPAHACVTLHQASTVRGKIPTKRSFG